MMQIYNVDDLMFDVEEHPVFIEIPTVNGIMKKPIPEKKALVDASRGTVLGVVGRAYKVVTNEEALDLAHQCCESLFPETSVREWRIEKMECPQTYSYSHVELVHNTTALDFNLEPPKKRPEAYGPFVRVVNSFNGQYALTFHIGFMRKVCSNGLILPESVVKFRFNHNRDNLNETITFNTSSAIIQKLRSSLDSHITFLSGITVPKEQLKPLVMKGLGIQRPKHADKQAKVKEDWESLNEKISSLCTTYQEELGDTAYAALNVMTDFASNFPSKNRCVYRTRHSFQQLAGLWIRDFSAAMQKHNFDLEKYLTPAKVE
jgi:hypothetical protein